MIVIDFFYMVLKVYDCAPKGDLSIMYSLDIWRSKSRERVVLNKVRIFHWPIKFDRTGQSYEQSENIRSRTDSLDNHVNGGGNYGFCSESCNPTVSTRFVVGGVSDLLLIT